MQANLGERKWVSAIPIHEHRRESIDFNGITVIASRDESILSDPKNKTQLRHGTDELELRLALQT